MAEIKTLKDGSTQIAPRTYVDAVKDVASGKSLDTILGTKADKASIPTKVSELANDSGFINKDVANLTNYTMSGDYAKVATSGSYNDLSNKPTIPSATSDITNDSGFITNKVSDLVNYTKSADLSAVATSGKYSDLSGVPTIPTKTSQLTNDSGYIDKGVSNLMNYTKSTSLAAVATSGDYADLSNKPVIPSKVSDLTNDTGFITNSALSTYSTTVEMNTAINAHHDSTKQDKLATQNVYTAKGSGTKVAQITTNSLGQVTNIDEVDITKTTLTDMGVSATSTELNILDGATLTTAELNYVDGVTSNIQTQLNNKESKDSTILKQVDVVDNLESTSTIYPLSAKQGKDLQTQINKLKNIGKFLSLWDCTTGQPTSQPESLPYVYNVGDYYRVSAVAGSEGTNYRPFGTSYTGAASTLVDTGIIKVGTVYYFDGTTWLAQTSSEETSGVQDVQINGVTIVDASVANITKAKLGLGNVENKSSETIRSEITVENIPNLPTSKITTGTFSDARIASATNWNAKQDALDGQVAYTSKGSSTKVPQITTNVLGQVTNITEVDIALEKTTLADLGITATADELNYTAGVTSAIQTQLDSKQDSSTLGDLAFKDSASASYTPSGTISTPTITITPKTTNVSSVSNTGTLPSFIQGEDEFSAGSFKQGADTFTQGSFTQGEDEFSAGSFKQGADTFTQGSFTQGKDSFKSGTFSAGTLPTFSYAVTNENLVFTFTQGTLPSHGADTFSQGTDSFTKPTFTQGTDKFVAPSFTQGTDSFTKPTFSQGEDEFVAPTFSQGSDEFGAGALPTIASISVMNGATATSSQPTFTGKDSTIEVK